MQVRLNSDELQALEGLPYFVRCVYLFGIRPHMDYATGLVGEKRRISWQSIAESLYVEPHQGLSESGTPAKARLRRAVEWLEKAGALEGRTQGKQLVFRCCYATVDSSAEKKPGTNPAQTRHSEPGTEADTPKPTTVVGFRGKPGTQPGTNPAHPETEKPGTPPESGIRREETPSVSPPSASKPKQSALDLSVLPDDLSEQVWKDWIQHRRDKRSPVKTQTVVNMVTRELERARELGWSPDEAMAESMAAGWTGVKAEWLANRQRKVAGSDVGHKRRGGFGEIDHRGEAQAAGFATEENAPWRR